MFVLAHDCAYAWLQKKKGVGGGHTASKIIYKIRTLFLKQGTEDIKCYPMQFCYRWFAQIGDGISASNQLAFAVSLSCCFESGLSLY